MVQFKEPSKLCKCRSRSQNVIRYQGCRSNTPRPITNSKYSTINYAASCSGKKQDYEPNPFGYSEPTNYSYNRQNNSCRNKYTVSSCLVGFMKYIQHQCNSKRRQEYDQSFLVVHDDMMSAMKQLKCDLNIIADMENRNCGLLTVSKAGETPKKILTRMGCKIFELEEQLAKPNIITCNELLIKRKIMLQLIKSLQKTVGCYLESEVVAMKDRQAKLCNLLKCLQGVENEFRCMTKCVKTKCCSKLCDQDVARNDPTLLTRKKSCLKPSSSKNQQCKSGKNYDVTGVDVIYTKSTVKTLEPDNDCDNEAANSCNDQQECIDKKITCHVPASGQPICEMKICDGNETVQICESEPLKETLCRISNVWHESAKQLIDAFYSC